MTKTARWRKQPNETGLRSIGQAPRGFELRRGDEVVAYVSPAGGAALNGPLRGWYWVGFGVNTYSLGELFATAEDAKHACDIYRGKGKQQSNHFTPEKP
jgi:hypothetical protein